jgi:hypothetical protein
MLLVLDGIALPDFSSESLIWLASACQGIDALDIS